MAKARLSSPSGHRYSSWSRQNFIDLVLMFVYHCCKQLKLRLQLVIPFDSSPGDSDQMECFTENRSVSSLHMEKLTKRVGNH
jgi:hypothetical protein